MGRPPRLQVAGAVYHITCNGARDVMLYRDEDDRRIWFHILAIALSRADMICHSYCQMGTHFHLVLETREPNIALGMQRLNWLYSLTFNKKYGTRGHLFEARYGAKLIQSESHLLNTISYIARNPVEAGLCRSPLDWPWSSYRATVGLAEPPPFLTIAFVLAAIDDRPEVARRQLRWMVEGLNPFLEAA
jgi:REP element-mobilizing transposase RayT